MIFCQLKLGQNGWICQDMSIFYRAVTNPFLTSRMAVSLINGIQSQGVIATAKHFAANNQEWNRHHVSSDLDERTLREIYLPAFEASVKEAKVGAIMTSYNLINGIHASEHSMLNNDIARNEWGI